jgi:protein-glutamine gamma-glutamyltransferase
MSTPTLYPNLSALSWLMATLILVVLPHSLHLAWWILPAFFIILLWRYWITRQQWPLPSWRVQFALILLLSLAILLSYRTVFGRDASIALLVILCGLKLVEMKSLRDALLLCFLSYFLIITNFLYSQTIPTALYMGIVMVVATATLISLTDNKNSLSVRQRLRLSTTLLLQALPVMLVLFILFPRVAGPFWSLPKDAHTGKTGLSDSMSLGTVSQLIQSNEIAFRVEFKGAIPPSSERYWRGPVLWQTNGRDWEAGIRYYQQFDQVEINQTGQAYDYTVTLEPHNERWLFALDLPLFAPHESHLTPDYQILAHYPVQNRMRYQVRSYTSYQANMLNYQQLKFALRLPKNKHPRARALAQEWRQAYPEQPEAIVQRALQYFNQAPFVYTYTPPLLYYDPIDEFLFETRQGFCEHYAAAFTVLMREAGIPARVVTGYLGGTVNPIGRYLIVRQRDAHAWSEVFLQDKGWVRIDPTHAVAPERIDLGIETALPTDFNPLGLEVNWDSDNTLIKMWQQIRNRWDAFNHGWNKWVLGYGPARQKQFLSRLGLAGINWRGMMILLISLIAFFLLTYATWMFLRTGRVRPDPVQHTYQRFCKKLARQGLARLPYEGPLTYAQRVSAARPDLAETVQQIIELYVQTRYRSQVEILPQLRAAVRRFRI